MPSDQEVVDDLVEMGVIPEPVKYTGIRLIDFFLNHHMTPLFTLFLATAIIRYLYSTGRIFPLADGQRGKPAQPAKDEQKPSAEATKEEAGEDVSKESKTSKSLSTTDADNMHESKSSSFRLGYLVETTTQKLPPTDQKRRAECLLEAASKVKNIQLVNCTNMKDDLNDIASKADAVYVGLSIAEGREDAVRSLLETGTSVLVEHPAAPSSSGIRSLQKIAAKKGARLVEAVPSRFAMSWERVIGTLHAEVGDVKSVEVFFVTGRVRRFILWFWNFFFGCGCRSGHPTRRRHNANASVDDVALLSLSLVAEILESAGSSRRDGHGGGAGDDGIGAGTPGYFIWNAIGKGHTTSRGPTHARGRGKYVYCLHESRGGHAIGNSNLNTTSSDGVSVSVHCEVASHTPWFPRSSITVFGSEATVVYEGFDSAIGEQVVRVRSKHGFSHTDAVASVFDAYTLAVVSFVRECKFGRDEVTLSGSQVSATAKALTAARKLGLR